MRPYRRAVSRGVIAAVIVILLVVAAVGVLVYTRPPSATSTVTSISTAISTSLATSISTLISTSTVVSTSTFSSTSSTSTPSAPKVLTIDAAEFPAVGLSPTNYNYPNWYYADLYQSLVMINDSLVWSTGQVQIVPCLADSWTVSSNNLTYTMNLRQGVTFSNGDPFNAYEVWANLYTLYYMSGNSSGFELGYDVFANHMMNADFGPATLGLITTSGLANPSPQLLGIMENSSWPIYVTGPYQIVFQLQHPFEWFLALLAPSQLWDMQWEMQNGGPGTPSSPSTYMDSNSAPGTGPYMVTGYAANSYVEFIQNPTYWGKNLTSAEISANVLLDPGHVSTVIMQYKSDDVARYTDLSTGAAQISDILAPDWPTITANPNTYSYVVSPPWSSTAFGVALNTQLYPTNDTALRQAIFHAINYTALIDEALGGEGVVGIAPEYPSFSQFYDLGNLTAYSYNLTQAIQILKTNNIDTSTLPTITLEAISGCTWCLNAAEVIQSDLAQLNITVGVDVVLSTDYYSYAIGSYSMMVQDGAELGNINFVCALSATPDGFTPADAWTTFVSNQSPLCNLAVYNNPIAQACVNAWFNGSSISEITSICTQAQKQIYDDAPYVFFVPRLWWIDGSTVWLTNGPVAHFYMDPEFSGTDTDPFINTVTFK